MDEDSKLVQRDLWSELMLKINFTRELRCSLVDKTRSWVEQLLSKEEPVLQISDKDCLLKKSFMLMISSG